MADILLIAFAICCIQLEGTYMRFLAFSDKMLPLDIRRLWLRLALTALGMFLLYVYIFSRAGIAAAPYKGVLFLGWVPYQLMLLYAVRGRWLEHAFVFGMYALWCFILHNLSNIFLALFLMGREDDFVLEIHALLFSLWFLLVLPLSKACFASLLPAFGFFRNRWVRLYTALLPFIMLLGFILLIVDSTLWHTWEERLARLLLPIAFFLAYHYVLKGARRIYAQRRLEQRGAMMEAEAAYLAEGKELSQKSLREAREQQENLLATYRELRRLIQAGRVAEARALIARQDKKLSASSVTPYTNYPIVNAAISIYLKRAEERGIKVRQRVNLPKKMYTDENELAVLLSNLLENALLACLKEPGEKSIGLILQHRGGECVLELTNSCTAPLGLGEDGLPQTNREGHGLGMLSLRNFLEKYDAYADFSQAKGIVTLSMYWEDKPC